MPSPKDPVTTVQPGPGNLPAGTVSATALSFNPAAGSNAALQAHITDPIGAHEATAISNNPLGGLGPRASVAIEVQTSLDDVYSALNSQAVWVLDVAGSAADSDYFGASALVQAINAIVLNSERKILFLRPGTYTWSDPQVFAGVTIIGDANGVVEIQSATGMRIGADASFKNVFINLATNLVMQDTGYSSLQNVDLDVNGFVLVQSPGNSFQQCQRSSGGSPLYFDVSESHNSFTQVTASQLSDSSAVGGNSYQDLVLNSTPKDSTTNVLSVGGSYSSFSGVQIVPTGAFTDSIVSLSGSFNSIRDMKVGLVTSTTGAVIEIGGSNNLLDFVRMHNVSASVSGIEVAGSHNTLKSVWLNLVTSSTQGVLVTGDYNLLDDVTAQSTTAPKTLFWDTTAFGNEARDVVVDSPSASGNVLACDGTSNVFNSVKILTVASGSVTLSVNGAANRFRDVYMASVSATFSLVESLGSGNQISGLTISTGTATGPSGHPIHFSGATRFLLENVLLQSVSGTLGVSNLIYLHGSGGASDAILRNIRFVGCTNCNNLLEASASRSTISNLEINSSGGNGSLISISGNNVEFDTVKFDTLTSVNVALIAIAGSNAVVRNVQVSNTTVVAASGGFRFVQMGGTGAHIDGFTATNLATMGATAALFNFSQSTTGSTIENVVLDNLGATVELVGPLASMPTATTNSMNTFRNWTVSNIARGAGSIKMFDFDTGFTDGAILDNIVMSGCSSTAGPVTYFNFAGTSTDALRRILVKNCRITNALVANHRAVTCQSTLNPVDFEDCAFQTNEQTDGMLHLQNCSDVSFTNCTFVAPCCATVLAGGAVFTNCLFMSNSGAGATNVQIVSGYGRLATATTPPKAFELRSCTILTSLSNNVQGSTTKPNVFLGGSTTTAPASHGAVVVDGLTIGRNPAEAFTFWHRSPLLTIDTANQSPQVESSFNNITIDMENIPFTGDASGSAVFADTSVGFTGSGCVVEIHGPDTTESVPGQTKVSGLSILRIPRQAGAGNRCVVMASGVHLQNLLLDAAAGTAGSWNGPALALNGAMVTGADFWPTTSLPLGAAIPVLYAELNSRCDKVRMRNFRVAAAEQGFCALLDSSSLNDSYITMVDGSHVGVAMVGAVTDCWVLNNKIEYWHYATSSVDVRIPIQVSGDRTKVVGNSLTNFAASSAAGYSSSPGSSNGGGCRIDNSGDNVTIMNNILTYEWETDLTVISAIASSGQHCKILGNFVTNTASAAHGTAGGTTSIHVSAGLYSNVSNNTVIGNNTGARINIDTSTGSAGSSIVMGNQLDNLGGIASIALDGTDLPTPASSYNILT